jgi:hypothetical protein
LMHRSIVYVSRTMYRKKRLPPSFPPENSHCSFLRMHVFPGPWL